VIVMSAKATPAQVRAVVAKVRLLGCTPHVSHGRERTIVGVVGHESDSDLDAIGALDGVERVVRVLNDYPLASRDFHPADRVITLNNGAQLGGSAVLMMAGPCAVEGRGQLTEAAQAVAAQGVRVLRGGAFKPRTSPYSFQGLGEEGLVMLRQVADELGLAVVTEVLSSEDVALVARYADLLQVGARNMQNYRLLQACGAVDRPVLLKRGLAATLDELMQAAEYILAGGNHQVALCERGIRSFEPSVRFTLDITAIPVLKQLTSLPIVVDPSHAAGRAEYVGSIARAAVAAGADGLLVEVHPRPSEALSDGAQSLDPRGFQCLYQQVGRVAEAVGRCLA